MHEISVECRHGNEEQEGLFEPETDTGCKEGQIPDKEEGTGHPAGVEQAHCNGQHVEIEKEQYQLDRNKIRIPDIQIDPEIIQSGEHKERVEQPARPVREPEHVQIQEQECDNEPPGLRDPALGVQVVLHSHILDRRCVLLYGHTLHMASRGLQRNRNA